MGELYDPGKWDNISQMSTTLGSITADPFLETRVEALEVEVYEPDPSTPNPPE